jgi:hypothetical protein
MQAVDTRIGTSAMIKHNRQSDQASKGAFALRAVRAPLTPKTDKLSVTSAVLYYLDRAIAACGMNPWNTSMS